MLEYVLWHLFGWEKPDMHDALIEHWNSRDTCPNCGETLEGDGYSNGNPVRCPNALEEDWWYSEPDSGPWLCSIDEDYDEPTEIDEWASFDPDC